MGNGSTIHIAYVQLCFIVEYIARTTSGGKMNYKQYNTIMNLNLLDVCLVLYISINLYFFFLRR